MNAYTSHITAARWHRSYRLSLEIGLVLSLLGVLGLFHLPLRMDGPIIYTYGEQEVVRVEDIQPTHQPERPPPPPRAMTPVAVPDDALPDEEPLNLDAALDLNAGPAVTQGPPAPAPEEEPDEPSEQEIFVVVEEMPELIGGIHALYEAVEYPPMAVQAGLEGMVIVEFVITPEGLPSRPVVRRSAGALLDEAAVAALMKQRFTPGKQRGRPVMVRFTVPVRFQLDR